MSSYGVSHNGNNISHNGSVVSSSTITSHQQQQYLLPVQSEGGHVSSFPPPNVVSSLSKTITPPTTVSSSVSATAIYNSKDHIDPADAAFWELDNISIGSRIYTWLEKQFRIAIKEAYIVSLQQQQDHSNNKDAISSADLVHAEELVTTILPVLQNNLINSLVSLTVSIAPDDLVNELTSSVEDDDEEEDDDSDAKAGTNDDSDNDNDSESDNDDDDNDDDDGSHGHRQRKRQKRNKNNGKNGQKKQQQQQKQKKQQLKAKRKPKIRLVQDPYKVWFQQQQSMDDNIYRKGIFMYNNTLVEIWNESQDDIPESAGGKLSLLSVGGILNGIVSIPATIDPYNVTQIITIPGLCQKPTPTSRSLTKLVAANTHLTAAILSLNQSNSNSTHAITIQQLHTIAARIHKSIEDQVKLDILQTTPYRIQQLLASDLTQQEFVSVRKRIHDTVILGKGMGHSNVDEDELKEIPTASTNAQSVHDIEKHKKCSNCGNNDQSLFVLDRRNGDITCSNCGLVVSESLMHEGSQFRKFEGEVDRNHHGDTANPLYSNAHNMGTSLAGVLPTTGAGIGGFGSSNGGGNTGGGGARRSLETILKNAHAYTEMNLSKFGKNDRRTRVGYKDRQKKEAFVQITHAGEALNLHDAVIQRSKELFSNFRDDRELIQQFKGVLAACLCEAFEQFSYEGKNILKQQQLQQEQQLLLSNINHTTTNNSDVKMGEDGSDNENDDTLNQSVLLSSRATRRKNLHHANLAGKGGVLLNNQQQVIPTTTTTSGGGLIVTSTATIQSNDDDDDDKKNHKYEKSAASWDLEDCRTWLFEASRRIAQAWVEERTAGTTAQSKLLPTGPIEDVEGQLVEYSFVLCEHLENELRSRAARNNNNSNSRISTSGSTSTTGSVTSISNNSKRRVVTPRVTDMSKLGIKWQGAHERGSGGKGGVGNNARTNSIMKSTNSIMVKPNNGVKTGTTTAAATNTTTNTGPTAGQILLLKTSQKLSLLLNNDTVAGDAFHKELRTLIGRQEEKKRLALRDEATRQRLLQMQRKSWLAARVQQPN